MSDFLLSRKTGHVFHRKTSAIDLPMCFLGTGSNVFPHFRGFYETQAMQNDFRRLVKLTCIKWLCFSSKNGQKYRVCCVLLIWEEGWVIFSTPEFLGKVTCWSEKRRLSFAKVDDWLWPKTLEIKVDDCLSFQSRRKWAENLDINLHDISKNWPKLQK